jgi:hypothetical protein
VVAVPLRCRWTGNRGCLHEGREIVRHHRGTRWIICEPEFRGRWMQQWLPRRFTWLYFHDEAVALAAGHRPCAQCRWAALNRYREAAFGRREPVPRMDTVLQAERWDGRAQRSHAMGWASVPDGAFTLVDGVPTLVLADGVVPWTAAGYGAARPRPSSGAVTVLTPPTSCRALAAGYQPQLAAGS